MSEDSTPNSTSHPSPILLALAFEGGLGLLAIAMAWLTGIPLGPWPTMGAEGGEGNWHRLIAESQHALGWGLAGTLPLLGILVFVERVPIGFLRDLGTLVQRQLGPLLRSATWWQLGLLSLLAGIGEELLFRGWLQFGLGGWLFGTSDNWGAILFGAVFFGMCHAVTRTYAVIAGLVGVYLGLLQVVSGHLIAPIVAHACYDFVALLYLLRWLPQSEP